MSRRWSFNAKPTTDTANAHPYGLNPFGHQGLAHDATTGLIVNNERSRHPVLGRFTTRDPINTPLVSPLTQDRQRGRGRRGSLGTGMGRYADGMNLYQMLGSNPVNAVDPNGLQPTRKVWTYEYETAARPLGPVASIYDAFTGAFTVESDFYIKVERRMQIDINIAGRRADTGSPDSGPLVKLPPFTFSEGYERLSFETERSFWDQHNPGQSYACMKWVRWQEYCCGGVVASKAEYKRFSSAVSLKGTRWVRIPGVLRGPASAEKGALAQTMTCDISTALNAINLPTSEQICDRGKKITPID
jgi:hypothetical protein